MCIRGGAEHGAKANDITEVFGIADFWIEGNYVKFRRVGEAQERGAGSKTIVEMSAKALLELVK